MCTANTYELYKTQIKHTTKRTQSNVPAAYMCRNLKTLAHNRGYHTETTKLHKSDAGCICVKSAKFGNFRNIQLPNACSRGKNSAFRKTIGSRHDPLVQHVHSALFVQPVFPGFHTEDCAKLTYSAIQSASLFHAVRSQMTYVSADFGRGRDRWLRGCKLAGFTTR